MNSQEFIAGAGDSSMDGALMRQFREKLRVKEADLAKGLGITVPQLLDIESDKIKISQWQYADMSMLIVDFFLVACEQRIRKREAAKESGD